MRKAHEATELISNRNHIKVKQLRELQSPAKRHERGLCLVEGMRFVYKAIECGAHIESVVIAPRLVQNSATSALLRKLKRWGVPVIPVTTEVFHYLSLSDEPQGIAAVVRQRIRRLPRTDKAQMHGRWIALSDVRSPGNLGTMLRCAEGTGANGLILLGDSVDPYSPECVRATMGSLFSQYFIRTTHEELLNWKWKSDYKVVGTSPHATTDYQSIHYPENTILLMGSERKGLSHQELELCDVIVKIPMVGHIDSLNLAMATTVMLYELFNQSRHLR